jgi:hypothetical protein
VRRGVRANKVAQSLTVLLLTKEKEELMMRGGQIRKMLVLRLFVLLVARKAIRVMLALRILNGAFVVAVKDIHLQSVSMGTLCVLTAMKRVILGLNARIRRRLRLEERFLLLLVLRLIVRIG